jgi:hypothetical protein
MQRRRCDSDSRRTGWCDGIVMGPWANEGEKTLEAGKGEETCTACGNLLQKQATLTQ